MPTEATTSTGTRLLDELIDGVHVGDNLVFEADDPGLLDLLVHRFVAEHAAGTHNASAGQTLVRVSLDGDTQVPPNGQLLDISAASDLAEAIQALHATDEAVGTGAIFVFDSLASVEQAYGAGAALELFLAACPRLYRRRSLALWPVDRRAHAPSFLRRLAEITQVVLELTADNDGLRVTVLEADGRNAQVVGRTVRAVVVDGDLQALDEPTAGRKRLGKLLRDRRLHLGISQTEVARRVSVTPSALSQIERGVRGPSGDTLVRLWEVLGVPFGPASDTESEGYRVARRSGRERIESRRGMSCERLAADTSVGQQWLVEVAPGAEGDRPPFSVKRGEIVTVVRGVFDVTIDGRIETLHEGDALVAEDAVIVGWANPGPVRAELVWTIG